MDNSPLKLKLYDLIRESPEHISKDYLTSYRANAEYVSFMFYLADTIDSDLANLNKQDERGRTFLMQAAVRGYLDVVKLLVEAGADHTIRCNEIMDNGLGMDAAKWAAINGCFPVKNYLNSLKKEETANEQ